MLIKDKSFMIHHQNIQSLVIETYKPINNLPGGNLSEFFVRDNHNENLCSKSELLLTIVNTVLKGQNFNRKLRIQQYFFLVGQIYG